MNNISEFYDKVKPVLDKRERDINRKSTMSLFSHILFASLAIILSRFGEIDPLHVLLIVIAMFFINDLFMIHFRENIEARFNALLIALGFEHDEI